MTPDLARRAEEHDFTAAFACARAKIEDAIRFQHDLRIVLDDDERIARIAQPLHHADDAQHVPRMQADRGLVQYEQRVHEGRAERSRQVDALDFAAG